MAKYVFYFGEFDPMTVSHEKIIRELYEDFGERLVIGVADCGRKQCWKPLSWRIDGVVEYCESLYSSCFDEVKVVGQNCPVSEFLKTLKYKVGTIVVGMDEWRDLLDGKWENGDKLIRKYRFLVIPRTNDVSSAKVRELVAEGADECELLRYASARTLARIRKKANRRMEGN